MIRLGGDSSGPAVDWVKVEQGQLINGFTTDPNNPFSFAVAEFLGQRYLLLRGTLITPNPRPAADVMATVSGLWPRPAFVTYQHPNSVPGVGWNVAGRRGNWNIPPIDQGASTALVWRASGSDVAGEANDMSALGAIRLV